MQLLIIIRRDDPPDTQLFVPLQDSSLSAVRRWATARARSILIIAELLEDITDGAREILTSCPHRRSRLLGGLVRGFSVLLQAAKKADQYTRKAIILLPTCFACKTNTT
jgi:hypothetical protein